MRVDLHSLRLFNIVAEEGNLTRAADRGFIAPSALSKRIADLESAYKVKLFQRHPRGLALTQAGQMLARHVQHLERTVDELEREMMAYSEGRKGSIRIYSTIAAIEGLLSLDLLAFSRMFPDITIDIQDCLSSAVIRAVQDRAADIGVMCGVHSDPELCVLPYRMQHLVVLMPMGHPLAVKSGVRLSDIIRYELVSVRSGSSLDTLLVKAAAELGETIRFRIRVSGYVGLMDIVSAGEAIGLVPDNCVHAAMGMVTRPLDEPWSARSLSLCYSNAEGVEPAVRLLGNFLAEQAEQGHASSLVAGTRLTSSIGAGAGRA
jgi:DNA-binding transcriptional LysR family regulator